MRVLGFRSRLALLFVGTLILVQGLTALLAYATARRQLVEEGGRQLSVNAVARVDFQGGVVFFHGERRHIERTVHHDLGAPVTECVSGAPFQPYEPGSEDREAHVSALDGCFGLRCCTRDAGRIVRVCHGPEAPFSTGKHRLCRDAASIR